ncbi:acyltransferase [Pseudoflavonifractor sp. 524-17]|uniref:acyltransferase family protein n=1 Tax=Pseudoflavonifractor sp. 524-17 TaxID=2304577 RepID=UPI001379C668|nr:acyltransferase [Pseudoflavonifractor sp. 524-17]
MIIACIFHYEHFYSDALVNYPFYNILAPFYNYGYLCVEMFLMLSGFKFVALYEKKISEGEITFSEFIKKRLIRLYPLFGIMTVVTQILQMMCYHRFGWYFLHESSTLYDMLLTLLGVTGILNLSATAINGPAWTMPIEMTMYIIFFFVAKRAKIHYIGAYFCALLFGLTVRGWGCWYPLINGNLARGLISFFLGALICKFQQQVREPRKIAVGSFCGLLFSVMIWIFWGKESFGDFDGYFALIILPSILLLFLNSKVAILLLSSKIASFFGRISYSMYLVHFPITILIAMAYELSGRTLDSGNPALLYFRTVLILVASIATYYLLEQPLYSIVMNRMRKLE